MTKKKVIAPNVVRGGMALPLGDNYYYMIGRKHSQGGIDIGENAKNGLEVESGEVMKMGNKDIKVFSSLPFLNGKSPAQKILGGENPNQVFNQQERFKDINKINDDGTKKAAFGKKYNRWKKKISKYKNINIDNDNTYDYEGYYNENPRRAWNMLKENSNNHFTDTYKTSNHPTFSNLSKYSGTKNKFNPNGIIGGNWVDNKYTLSNSQLANKWDVGRTINYLEQNESNGVKTYYPDGRSLDYADGSLFGGVLPEVTITNKKAMGGNINKRHKAKAGTEQPWRPSQATMNQISKWEGSTMAVNKPFHVEADGFNSALGDLGGWLTDEEKQGLYSYSYNVGSDNFRKRVVPALKNLREGKGTVDDVTNAMWASKDKNYKGLRIRRNTERQWFKDAYAKRNIPKVTIPTQPLLADIRNIINTPNIVNGVKPEQQDNTTVVKNPLQELAYKFNNKKEPVPVQSNINFNTDYLNRPNLVSGLRMNKKKYKAGGLYSITVNGETKLKRFPSTGERQKAAYGKDSIAIPNLYNTTLNPINPNTNIKPKITKPKIFRRFINRIKTSIKNDPSIINDTIGLASNTIGGIISNRINNRMLNRLQYSPQPVPKIAKKLKTTININPQLDAMRESLAAYENDVNNNTASSNAALARRQQFRLANILNTNNLYGDKENKETTLINTDRINQQEVANKTIDDYNTWARGETEFRNNILEKKADNNVALMENLNLGVQDLLTRRERRFADRQNRLAMLAAYPNVNPRILMQIGIKGITKEDVDNWDNVWGYKAKPNTIVR